MVWDFDAGRELSANDQAHSSSVDHIVTGDKDLVVTASSDNSIRIWDAASGKQKRRLMHDSGIPGIALSLDGTLLVSSSMDVCLWNVDSGQKIFKLPGHGGLGGRRAVTFTPDGKFFLSWGDDMNLRKWDVKTGKAVAEYAIRPTGIRIFGEDDEPMDRERLLLRGGVTEGIFTPDARELVLYTRNEIFVFDAASGKELRKFPMESSFLIGRDISPDGQLFLTSTWGKPVTIKLPDGRLQSSTPMNHPVSLWELASGGLRKQITLPEQGAGPVAFSRDGKLFAAASHRPGDRIRVWDASGQEVRVIEGFRGIVSSLAFMADGKRLVTGMEDGSALVWDLTQKP
jgi:WD40 repeat protein